MTGAAEIAERDQDHVPEVKANSQKHQRYFPDESSSCLIYFVILENTWNIFIFSTGVVVWSLYSSLKF